MLGSFLIFLFFYSLVPCRNSPSSPSVPWSLRFLTAGRPGADRQTGNPPCRRAHEIAEIRSAFGLSSSVFPVFPSLSLFSLCETRAQEGKQAVEGKRYTLSHAQTILNIPGFSESDAIFRKFYQRADGPCLDVGAFAAGLEYATGCRRVVIGKPSAAYFQAALDHLGATMDEVRRSTNGGMQIHRR